MIPGLPGASLNVDEVIDDHQQRSYDVVAGYLRANPDKIEQGLYIISMIRKREPYRRSL